MPVIAPFLSLIPQLRRRRWPVVFKEREQIEQDLRDRNRLVDGILKGTPASIYIFDCDQGRNEVVSARAQTLLGYADAEWQERSSAFLELMHPDDRGRLPAHFDHIRSAPDGTILQFEYRVRHADGGWRWFLSCDSSYERGADGSLRKILGTAFDITDRKRIEDASQQSEARYRAIFENAAVGIALVKPDGSWLQVNERLRDFLGYSADEFERLTFQDLTYPEDLAADLAQVRRVLDGEIDNYDMEKRYIRKDGGMVWAHLTVGCIRASDKTVELFVSVVEDIGARKTAELELHAISERDRIEAQAQIAYLAHHDALTELPNRRTFELYLEAALERARTLGEQLAVIYIGLDHFKQINDLFGAEVGDSVLFAVAQRLTDTVQTHSLHGWAETSLPSCAKHHSLWEPNRLLG